MENFNTFALGHFCMNSFSSVLLKNYVSFIPENENPHAIPYNEEESLDKRSCGNLFQKANCYFNMVHMCIHSLWEGEAVELP